MVYKVESESNPKKTYRVDLTAMGGYSQCSCADWAMRRSAAAMKKKPMGTRETACKHILAARTHFLNGLLVAMATSEEAPIQTPHEPHRR
jgi:hypothetical protein